MLSTEELKAVISTLSQRRAFLLKSVENTDLNPASKDDLVATVKILDSSIKKIAQLPTQKPPRITPRSSLSPPMSPPPKKTPRKQAIALTEAYVLIAEDNQDSATLLKAVLEDMGIKKIDVVEDGRAAVRALENCSPPYDVVLCDWDMPEMNGLEVRKAIKPLAKLRDTHFMMVTASSASNRIKEAILNGVDDYIVKPIDIDILEAKLKDSLAGEPPKKEDTIANKT